MRSFRRLLTAIGPVGLCGLVAVAVWMLPGHAAASLQADAWIEVRPSPVTAGRNVALRADCGTGETSATVTSTAFGRVSLHPFAGYLFSEVLVPTSTRAGGHSVSLACSNGETATTTMRVSTSATPTATRSVGPHTGGGFLARQDRGGGADSTGPAGWLNGPATWLIGSLAALAALAVALVSRRRGSARDSAPVSAARRRAGGSGRLDRGDRRGER